MTRLTKLWRTTTVRLTALFALIFVVFSIALLAFISYQSSIQIQQQQTADIDREIDRFIRLERQRGWQQVAFQIERQARQPGPGIYLLAGPNGEPLIGNVSGYPPAIIMEPGVHSFNYPRARPPLAEEDESPQGFAVVRTVVLESGLRLVIGRDVLERRGFTAIIVQSFLWGVAGILVASMIAGLVMSGRVLRRIDAISGTATKIMSGNLSERVPVTRRNDEFDGLATNLNLMLDRIEQLMQGLKEVSDNVAHDLKTPLTRLRNQAEAALREGKGEGVQDKALEQVIAESDKLIRTFNALLMIARAEAGAPSGAFADVDLSAVADDVAELYGPLAEESGSALETDVKPGVRLRGNRELLGQALVNLVENALKYAHPKVGHPGKIVIGVYQEPGKVSIEVSDNGPGIPAEERDRVVQRFVRLEKSRTEAGSGLGLSLVSAVARLHKGTFRIEDNQPGVRAIMELPVD